MKKLVIVLCIVGVTALILAGALSQQAEGKPSGRKKAGFAGVWTMPLPMVDGTDPDNIMLLHYSYHPWTITPIDSKGKTFNIQLQHAHCDRTLLGIVPNVTHASNHVGVGVQTGKRTLRTTFVGYRSECGSANIFNDGPSFIEISSAEWEMIDEDHMGLVGGSIALYSIEKDTNEDGLITEEDGDGDMPEPDVCINNGVLPFETPPCRRITLQPILPPKF